MKMQPKDLEVLLADFGKISRRILDVQNGERDDGWYEMLDKLEFHHARALAKSLQDSKPVGRGLVWYNFVWYREVEDAKGHLVYLAGRPGDYVPIRDNFDALKEFLFKTLDIGRLNLNDSGHTNIADYVTWMYLNSQHQPFKRNTERAIVELLKNELGRKFTPLKSEDEWHVKVFAQQFNRLAGLLDIISSAGEPDNGFAEAYGGLAQKAKERFMRDAPAFYYEVDYHAGVDAEINIYGNILQALSGIQKSDELRDLWLQNIREDNQTRRVVASIYGLFRAYKTKQERRRQIPAVLAKLQERGHNLDQTKPHAQTLLFKDDTHLLGNIAYNLVELPYGLGRFGRLDKVAASLDVLSRESIKDGKYHLIFTRYTPAGRQVLKATYDLRTDTIQGDVQLKKTVRAYFENGYEIGNKIKVTSLEGRRITGNETKIVEVGEQNVDELYEGLVGLDGTPFPFLYNAANGVILLAEPLDSMRMGGYGRGWVGKRAGLEKVTAKIPYNKFQPVSQFAQRVGELSKDIRREDSLLWDVYNSLSGRLSDKIDLPLSLVIFSKLVKAEDGLVQ